MRWTIPSFHKVVSFVAWSFVLAGIAVFGLQVFGWLDSGHWTSYPLLDGFSYLGHDFANWAAYPRKWVGLHTVLSWLSLSVGLVVLGIALGFFALTLNDGERA